MKDYGTILRVNKARAKRGFGLEKVMTKLSEASISAIAITFLVINLSSLLKEAFSLYFVIFCKKTVLAVYFIIQIYD